MTFKDYIAPQNNPIAVEYKRILDNYRWALERAAKSVEAEIVSLDECTMSGWRFNVRHALLDLAREINETDTKLKVFNNFTWKQMAEDHE